MAATATGIGVLIDAAGAELTTIFDIAYVAGCLTAVLVVRQAGLFTAVIQPPLILFCAVPGAYWLFHRGTFTGIKNILMNCGYPLIERFPLMLFTAAAVLLIGLGRWYFGMSTRRAAPPTDAEPAVGGSGWLAALTGRLAEKLTTLTTRRRARSSAATAQRRRRGERPARTPAPRRSGTTAARPTARSRPPRPARPPVNDAPPPPRRRPPPGPVPGADPGNGTHHPISRVRYRGAEPNAEFRADPRAWSHRPAGPRSKTWEYDG